MDIAEKIRLTRVSSKISQTDFAKLLGISQEVLSKIERGATKKIPHLVIENFKQHYSDAKNGVELPNTGKPNTGKPNTKYIPLYDVLAAAGSGQKSLSENVLEYIKNEQLDGCSAAIIVYGDSMHSVLQHRDIIGIKEITNIANVELGSIYVILTKPPDSEIFVKYVRKHPVNTELFLLKSENPNYDDMDILKTNIEKIWKQKGIIRY